MKMGINFLYEEYKKDPSKVEKLLEGKLEISEKLDGSRFCAQNTEGNKLLFFKRRDIAISKIDRTLSKYYDKAIFHFDSFQDDKLSQLPDGWRFGMEYFPNLHPVTISYDRLPLNNLVLTDIQVKDPKDRTVEVITDKETLHKWANILEVEAPPIIFEGELDNIQKRKILDFLNTPYTDLVKRFKTENFTTFILTLLNPSLKSSFLHNDMNKDIDGLVFRFNGKEAYRVSNPEIIHRKKEKKDEKPSDIYNLTLVFLQEFLTAIDFKKIKLKEKDLEERYIEFISQVFNKFLQTPSYINNFKDGVDFELQHFLTRAESESTFKFVKNPETLNYLKGNNTNRELFKILMASMRAHKKKPSGFFSKELINNHNQLVDKIADYISNDLKENVLYSFEEFKTVYLTESEGWYEEFGKEKIDISEKIDFIENPSFDNYEKVDPEITEPISRKDAPIQVLRKMFSPVENISKKKEKVCIVKGKFLPFHNGHLATITDAAKESGMKVLLVILNKRIPKENFIPENLHKEIISIALENNKDVKGHIFSYGKSITEVINDLPDNLEIGSFAGSEHECDDIKVQLGQNFPTYPMTKHVKSNSIIQKIKNEDYESYKKLVPESIHNYFYKIKNELK